MPRMNQAEIDAFLHGDRHAILATDSPGGAPQLTPVWVQHFVPLAVVAFSHCP